ncbi:MAG: recombinase family protein, partial [Thermoanaerobaculia bacterium]
LRQSSMAQVRNNLESQRLHYALADRARHLGWQEVEIIDTDLGVSASMSSTRVGFERLVATVALGEVGIVLAREASRLSRTDKDWCHLLEVCQALSTLIGDEEHIYDLELLDDQLILGIKGTLSVVELKVLKMRLLQGKEEKARRGELFMRLPPGYVLDGDDKVVIDPDERKREAVASIFRQYRELWSVRKTAEWFRQHRVRLPVNQCGHGRVKLVWKLPKEGFIYNVLTNPFYAGAYFYGRGTTRIVVQDGKLVKKRIRRLRTPEDCKVFIWDHHEGYIDRATYEENRERMRRSHSKRGQGASAAAVRKGQGLLAGLLRCGHCGRPIHVRYPGRYAARYFCRGDYAEGGNYCLSFGGAKVDRHIAEAILEVISPLGLKASLRAMENMRSVYREQHRSLCLELEQVEFEVQRAFEQYDQVDARNLLVAAELESRWNAKLEQQAQLRRAIAELEAQDQPLRAEDERTIRALGENFAQVWKDKSCPIELKKKIVSTVIEEVVASLRGETMRFVIHWKGGVHTQIKVPARQLRSSSKTPEEALEIIRKLAPRYGDDRIAGVLNQNGFKTGKGLRWTQMRVTSARRSRGIRGHLRTPANPYLFNLTQAAEYCGVGRHILQRLVADGVVTNEQEVPNAPWELRRAELDSESVREILEQYRLTGKYPSARGCGDQQLELSI